MTYNEDSRQLSLILPRQVVERGSHFNAVNCATRIAANTPLAAMANRMVLETRQQEGLDMQESEAVLDALVSLLLPGISARDSGADAHERQFRKTIAYIDEHISDEELCPELIAREVGISVRGLYRMFSKRGLVVAQYIKHRRLDFCAENLRRCRCRAEALGAVLCLGVLGFQLLLVGVQIALRRVAGRVPQAL